MKGRCGWMACLGAAALCGGNLRAELLIYEGFDYPPGTVGSNMTGGVNLRTSWGTLDSSNTTAQAGSLTYDGGSGAFMLATNGNHLKRAKVDAWWGERWIARQFDNTHPLYPYSSGGNTVGNDGTMLWVSFLYRHDGDPAADRAAFRIGPLFVGRPFNANGKFGMTLNEGGTFYDSGLTIVSGQTCLATLKFEFGAGNADAVSLWVNPSLNKEEPDGAYTNRISGADLSWGFFGGCGKSMSVDELRVGESFRDVVPAERIRLENGMVLVVR